MPASSNRPYEGKHCVERVVDPVGVPDKQRGRQAAVPRRTALLLPARWPGTSLPIAPPGVLRGTQLPDYMAVGTSLSRAGDAVPPWRCCARWRSPLGLDVDVDRPRALAARSRLGPAHRDESDRTRTRVTVCLPVRFWHCIRSGQLIPLGLLCLPAQP